LCLAPRTTPNWRSWISSSSGSSSFTCPALKAPPITKLPPAQLPESFDHASHTTTSY
jgi:hypothetical protein